MRFPCLTFLAIALAGSTALLSGCGSSAPEADESNITSAAKVAHIVPKPVDEYLRMHEFGTYHLFFHSSRHYFVGGEGLRSWLNQQHEAYANVQEGDPGSGIEFLTMHRAMIQHLRDKFGNLPVDNEKGYRTFSDVLDGWKTDAEVIAAIKKYSTSKSIAQAAFPAAAARANDVARFASDDEFGVFVQTRLRLGEVDPDDSFTRNYTRDASDGAGVHNSMHGWFADDRSPIDVGDPSLNLSNTLFWGIHGWIEAKWQQFEKSHTRSAEEQATYDGLMEKFGLHMQIHSHDITPAPKGEAFPKEMFADSIDCDNLAEGTSMEGCP